MENEHLKPESLKQIEKHHHWYITKVTFAIFIILIILFVLFIPLPTLYETSCIIAVPLTPDEPLPTCPKKA